MSENIIDSLNKIEGISVEDGLVFCGTVKALLKFLSGFYSNIDHKADEIEQAYKNRDISFYTTKVHALKSTSKIIGAFELSKLALELEEAGRKNDLECIENKTDKLLELFRSYKDKLSVLDELSANPEDDRKPIDTEELKDAYKSLAESVETMDYDAVELIIDELKKRRLSAKDEECISKLEKALNNFDWDEMECILG